MSPCCQPPDCWKRGQPTEWMYPTLILCAFGFFSVMRPIDSFFLAYLVGPDKNITVHQAMNEILPIWTYSCLVLLIPTFLLTDYLRHKPVIVLHGFALIILNTILILGRGVLVMKCLLFDFGLVAATNVAYFSYIYSAISSEHYQKATGYCRTVILVGHTLGSTLGQILISVGNASYFCLTVISLASVSVAFLTALLLPTAKKSMIFHREDVAEVNRVSPAIEAGRPNCGQTGPQDNPGDQTVDGLAKTIDHNNASNVFLQLWSDFKECYSSPQLLCWSLWWALATAGFNQVASYIQVLWEHIEPTGNVTVYNGVAETISNVMGAACAFAIGHTELDWAIWGELALGIFSVVNGGVSYAMTVTKNIWVCYVCYSVFKSCYMLLITITMQV
ncbi:thiamine transporter 2-like [Rhinoraja longicauda]